MKIRFVMSLVKYDDLFSIIIKCFFGNLIIKLFVKSEGKMLDFAHETRFKVIQTLSD